MKIQRATPVNELLAKLLFLIIPTAAVCYFLIWNASEYYGVIGDPARGLFSFLPPIANITLQLTLFATVGMVASAVFYAFRFRFLPTFLLLATGLFAIYKTLDSLATGEFDAFFISVQFLVFTILFISGWLIGWGFVRFRYSSVFVAMTLLIASIVVIARQQSNSVDALLWAFVPILLYSIYIIFTTEQIYSYKDKSQKFWWFLSRRLVLFGVLAAILLGSIVTLMRPEIEETVANFGGGAEGGKTSMLEQKKDGSFDLKDYSRLTSSLGRSNELLFAARIDNYFPGTDVPNPLYLTAFYYTKFDTLTETFERDSLIPYNDLFEPDPSKLPLFFTKTDSSVIENALGNKLRRTVEIEVYTKSLSPETYVAPSTGFFVQPVTIEKDFRNEFKSAFRAKSYVSELNSAYFIYNPQDNEELQQFQQQRFEVLRQVKGYEGVDSAFLAYYTYMPSDPRFLKIANLAKELSEGKQTPVDKVIALRDWFTSKDEAGEPLFQYTDNPGVPDIPSASRLMYFLFENRKGYCAYYAGATLFMLRSLGIPSRIVAGFLTVDRSDKNKGWYWYYADQAHAWVQVYFPGYGWLDFDTTVGNSDAQESPAPDGTPPMQPPKAWLAAEGIVQEIDTLKKLVKLQVRSMVFQDKEYQVKPETVNLDMKVASVKRDTMDVSLGDIEKGEQATAVSYAEILKNLTPGRNDDGNKLIGRFPDPIPIDEVYLLPKELPQEQKEKEQIAGEEPAKTKDLVFTFILISGLLLLAVFLSPTLVLLYLQLRYRNASNDAKPYWAFRTSTYYLNQLGLQRGELTSLQFAQRVVDPRFSTKMTAFMNIYLKQKYSGATLTSDEIQVVNGFLPAFMARVRSQVKWHERLGAFLRPLRMVHFLVRPEE